MHEVYSSGKLEGLLDRFYGVDIRLMLIDSWWETQVAAHLKDLQEVRESWLEHYKRWGKAGSSAQAIWDVSDDGGLSWDLA